MAQDGIPLGTFADIADALADEGSLDAALQRLVVLAVNTLPGSDHAAVSTVGAGGRVDTVAASAEVCQRVDQAQYDTGQGPCLDAIRDDDMVKVDDLSVTERWPRFSPRATELGIRSMLSFRMARRNATLGALNFYSAGPGAFGERDEALGHVFAAHASIAWNHLTEIQGLQNAMHTRNLIGQAQGVLMSQRQCTADEAFALLVSLSQRTNRKLRDVAVDLIESTQRRDPHEAGGGAGAPPG